MRHLLYLVLISCALLGSQGLLAQDVFKVLALRGSVTLVGGKGLAIGQKLKASDKLNVGKGAYVGLAHVNGRTVEIRQEGTVKLLELDKATSKKSSSVTGKFASYVVGELTEVSEPISFKDGRRANMRTTGSVERVAGDEVNVGASLVTLVGGQGELQALAAVASGQISSGKLFSLIMPRSTRILHDTVKFLWYRSTEFSRYKLVVTDRFDKTIGMRETTDTSLILSLSALGLEPGSLYYWHVENSADESARTSEYGLWILGGTDRKQSEDILAGIRADLENESSSIGSLVLAVACEDQGLMYQAYREYSSAVAGAPDVQNYKRLFAEFLLRQSLNLEAYLAYQ